jgi:hypothetical protein
MAIADVLLFSANPLQLDPEARKSTPPLSKAFEVAPGIQLAGVRPEIAAAVVANTRFRSPYPTDLSVMYGLVRYEPPGSSWDQDGAIAKVLFLSHLIHANEGGFEFTARIWTDDNGRLVDLKPGEVAAPFARAYCGSAARRRWLTQDDAALLRDLVHAYDRILPSLADTRLGLALSLFTESPFVFHGRPRGLLLTTTLEGLVSTMSQRAVKQFTTRVPALAAEVGLPQFDVQWARDLYKLRSKLAHGSSVLQSVVESDRQTQIGEFNQTLTDLDELLRRILRKALADAGFKDKIDNVDEYWPVAGKGCPVCRSDDADLLEVECPRCHSAWRR